LNTVIINKTKVLRLWLSRYYALCFSYSQRLLAYSILKIFWLWTYLMKVIPEKRHMHYIWYLRCYLYVKR